MNDELRQAERNVEIAFTERAIELLRKYGTGPEDTLVDVWWRMTPEEQREVDALD